MGAPQYEQAGADIGGTGTTNTIPRWTGASTLGDSGLIDDGSAVYTTTRNVGIGTASPTQRATIEGVGQTVGGTFKYNTNIIAAQSGGDAYKGLLLGYDTASNTGVIGGSTSSAASNLAFWTYTGSAWGERARIDSAGRLLVGTGTAPSSGEIRQLVAPGSGANGGQQWAAPTAGGAAITPIATNGGAIFYRYSGSVGGETYVERFNFSSTAIQFKDGANLLASIDNSGNVTLPFGGSTVNVSTTNAGVKLPATPGNTDPNTLDCYADGGTANSGGVTWTPELRFGGATTGITYASRVGRYTRVGNMIFATCYIALTSKGSATGAATIAGLPTSSNTSGLFSSGSIGYNVGVTYTNMLLVRMNANASAVTLTSSSAAGALANTLDTDFTNTSELVFSIAYPVT